MQNFNDIKPDCGSFPELDNYAYIGSWHGHSRVVVADKATIYVAGTSMGCGLGRIRGVINLAAKQITKKQLLKSLQEYKKNGLGVFLATLGQSYYKHEEYLLSLGFELLSEYPNYRHGAGYNQRLYILKT